MEILTIKLAIAALVLSLGFALWRYDSRKQFIFTPYLLVMYFAFVRIFPAFFFADTLGAARGLEPLLIMMIAFIAFVIGFTVTYFHKRNGPQKALQFSVRRVPHLTFRVQDHVTVLIISCALAFVGLWFYGGAPSSLRAIMSGLSGTFGSDTARLVSEQRFALTKAAYFGGEYRGQGLITTLMFVGWALVSVYALLYWHEKRTKFSACVLICALFVTWIFVAGSGTRGPFLTVLITLATAYSYRRVITLKGVIVAFIGICMLGIGLSLYSTKMYFLLEGRADPILTAITGILERIFIGNGINDVYVIESVNSGALEIGLGREHFYKLASALPGVQYGTPLAYRLYLLKDPGAGGSAVTFASGTYLSLVYTDFYVYGVAPIYFAVGCLVGFGQRWLFTLKPSPWNICVAAVSAYILAAAFQSGPISIVSNAIVLIIILLSRIPISALARSMVVKRAQVTLYTG